MDIKKVIEMFATGKGPMIDERIISEFFAELLRRGSVMIASRIATRVMENWRSYHALSCPVCCGGTRRAPGSEICENARTYSKAIALIHQEAFVKAGGNG